MFTLLLKISRQANEFNRPCIRCRLIFICKNYFFIYKEEKKWGPSWLSHLLEIFGPYIFLTCCQSSLCQRSVIFAILFGDFHAWSLAPAGEQNIACVTLLAQSGHKMKPVNCIWKKFNKNFSVHKHLHTKKCEIFSLFIRTLNVFSKKNRGRTSS